MEVTGAWRYGWGAPAPPGCRRHTGVRRSRPRWPPSPWHRGSGPGRSLARAQRLALAAEIGGVGRCGAGRRAPRIGDCAAQLGRPANLRVVWLHHCGAHMALGGAVVADQVEAAVAMTRHHPRRAPHPTQMRPALVALRVARLSAPHCRLRTAQRLRTGGRRTDPPPARYFWRVFRHGARIGLGSAAARAAAAAVHRRPAVHRLQPGTGHRPVQERRRRLLPRPQRAA
eukprot:scaffold9775_cov90-Isochrysis_galbana.AAC.2